MNKLSLICLLFFLIFSNVFANESAISERQRELAIFYYEVGQRYKDVGKIKKGQDFQNKALKIYPNLTKEVDLEAEKARIDASLDDVSRSGGVVAFEDVKLEEIPGIDHEKIEISDVTNAPKIEYIATTEREKNQDKAIKFQFDKFARALVSKNGRLLDSIIDEKIEINGENEDKAEFIQGFATSSANIAIEDLEYLSIDDFYDLNSVEIQKADENSYNIKVLAKENNITKNFPFFWNSHQILVFTKKGNKWLLSSIK